MDIPFKKLCNDENDTSKIAEDFTEVLKQGDIVLLNGNLGSGKTFFVKKICENLNIPIVTSPTFSIVNEYNGDFKVYHFDFYRLNNLRELDDIGFDEYLDERNAIIFVEWSDMFKEALPMKNIYRIDFNNLGDDIREISIKFIL